MSKTSKKQIKQFDIRHFFNLLMIFAVLCSASTADAYQLKDYKWPQPSTSFYVDIPGENGLWNDAFETAMYEWGAYTIFNFGIYRGSYEDPCDSPDGRNGVGFEYTNCGDAWGATTLASEQSWASNGVSTQSDIIFNSNKPWDVYSGPLLHYANDFHRVAVHELGHTLGLNHEDSVGVSTIMGTYTSDITVPRQDDINGVAALYLSPVPINGICGSSDGVSFDNAPTTNLCSVGTATTVTGTGPWYWRCGGSNGGNTGYCAASINSYPNLTPYQPSGWSSKIVVSTTTGTTTDAATIYNTDNVYIDWAVLNDSERAAGAFVTGLYVDGGLVYSWSTTSLAGFYYTNVIDYPLGTLSTGSHTISILADSNGDLPEGNESDNQYTKTITINIVAPVDSDGDGVIDDNDNCPNTPAGTVVDANGCALPPADTDNDGVIDDNDNCPLTANTNQEDADNDGLGDACDGLLDSDGDGIAGNLDNCPAIANPDQLDTDDDGIGDSCEEAAENNTPEITSTPSTTALEGEPYNYQFTATDPDSDPLTLSAVELPVWLSFSSATGELEGTPEYQDAGENTVTLQASDGIDDTEQTFTVTVSFTDQDNDGLPDTWETDNGLDPTIDNSGTDSDGDGVSDVDEYEAGTDPSVFDEPEDLDIPELTYQVNGIQVSISWSVVPEATGYILSYVPYPYNGHDVIATFDVGDAATFDAELWDGAAYLIAVQAYNNHGNSNYSNVEHFVIELAPPEPPVMSYEFTSNVITISWTVDDTADGYLLSYAPSPYTGPETIHSIDMGEDTSVQYTIPVGSHYYIAVQAYNAKGASQYSNIEEVTADE